MRATSHKLQRKHFSLSSLQIQRLERLAQVTDLSLSELARNAVDDFLDKRETALGLAPLRGDDGLSLKSDSS